MPSSPMRVSAVSVWDSMNQLPEPIGLVDWQD